MSESSQRQRVIRTLKTLGALPVENPVQPGTPDVNYIEGWIELKWMRRWPAGKGTVIRLPHFTRRQRRWLKRRWENGGATWLLLQVGREWLLFTGPVASDLVGFISREELYTHAYSRWTKGLNEKEFISCLKNLAN